MANNSDDKTTLVTTPAPRHTCDGRGGRNDHRCAGCVHDVAVLNRESPARAWRRIG